MAQPPIAEEVHGEGTGHWARNALESAGRLPCDGREPLSTVGEATVPASDDGLLRGGDGAFETVRVYCGRPFTLAEHLARLERSCATVRLACNREQLERDIDAIVVALGPGFPDLRVVLARGGRLRRLVFAEPMPPVLDRLRLALIDDTPRHVLAGAKTLSYTRQHAGQATCHRTRLRRSTARCPPRTHPRAADRIVLLCRSGREPLHTAPQRRDPGLGHAKGPLQATHSRGAVLHTRGCDDVPRGVCGKHGARGPTGRRNRDPYLRARCPAR